MTNENPKPVPLEKLEKQLDEMRVQRPAEWHKFSEKAKRAAIASFASGGLTEEGFRTLQPTFLEVVVAEGNIALEGLRRTAELESAEPGIDNAMYSIFDNELYAKAQAIADEVGVTISLIASEGQEYMPMSRDSNEPKRDVLPQKVLPGKVYIAVLRKDQKADLTEFWNKLRAA